MGDMSKRSNTWTSGLTCMIKDQSEFRLFFFELDKMHLDDFNRIKSIYENNRLDYLYHKTGSGGFHFLSPTVITKEKWKDLMNTVKDVNTNCPMLTLRMVPNKYYFEREFWYKIEAKYFPENIQYNLDSACGYLNHIFQTKFEGMFQGDIKTVRYRLPYV